MTGRLSRHIHATGAVDGPLMHLQAVTFVTAFRLFLRQGSDMRQRASCLRGWSTPAPIWLLYMSSCQRCVRTTFPTPRANDRNEDDERWLYIR
jgi:hypothetical protein